MVDSVRPLYQIPSIDQKDQPDVQPVTVDGPITATIDGEVQLDDTDIVNEISLVLAALIEGIQVHVAGQPVGVTVSNFPAGMATEATLSLIAGLLARLTDDDIDQFDVTTTEVAVPITVGQEAISIRALTTNTESIWLIKTGGVAGPAGTGYELPPGGAIEMDMTEAALHWLIAETTTQRACTLAAKS